MKIKIKYTCPYCALNQDVTIEKHHQFWEFYTVYCDTMQGGCDKPLTIKVELKPTITVYKLEEEK